MNPLIYFQQIFLALLVRSITNEAAKINIAINKTDNRFPFISVGEDGQVIVEAYPMDTSQSSGTASHPDNKLELGEDFQAMGNKSFPVDPNEATTKVDWDLWEICHHTYSLMDGQSMQFRSMNSKNMTSATCFESPLGTKISLSCCDFNVDCSDNSYFGVMLGRNSSHSAIKEMCRNESFSQQISESNYAGVIFSTEVMGKRSKRELGLNTFNCVVAIVKVGDDQLISGLIPSTSSSPSSTKSFLPTPKSGLLPTNTGACNCGQLNPQIRIVGGTVAEPNEFPWRCYILVPKGFCGCALISDEWVMTAAHCTIGVTRATVVLAAHQKGKGNYRMSTFPVQKIINHPRYQYNNYILQNDISLVKLKRPVNFTTEISPVCLPWKFANDDFSGGNAVTSGWGSTKSYGSKVATSDILRKVELSVISHRECARIWGRKVTNQMVCAYGPNKATCSGDSGGSLDLERNGHYYAIGLTSFGDRCQGRKPGVFARVTSYLKWIQSTTKEDFCKL